MGNTQPLSLLLVPIRCPGAHAPPYPHSPCLLRHAHLGSPGTGHPSAILAEERTISLFLVQLKQGWNFSRGSPLGKRRENKPRNKDYKNKEADGPAGGPQSPGCRDPRPLFPAPRPLLCHAASHPPRRFRTSSHLPLHLGRELLKATAGSSRLGPHAQHSGSQGMEARDICQVT